MSTVLWANVLAAGKVTSDQSDHMALYKHAEKLDSITKSLNLASFLGICDTTDQRFNLDDSELPPGMQSTNDVMAVQGDWITIPQALTMLEGLRKHIVSANVRFGLISNQQEQVVAELDEVLSFVKAEAAQAEKFNFCVVS